MRHKHISVYIFMLVVDKKLVVKGKKVIAVKKIYKVDKKIEKIKHKTNNYKLLDLFCGCGGFTSGLTRAGFDILAGVDVWDTAIKTYKKNFEHLALCKDLTKFSPEQFENETKIKNIDVLVGGPPCQGFSMAGKRDNKDPRNSLFMEYVKYLEYYKPKAFFMENVPGILSMKTTKGEKVINLVMKELSKNYMCKYYKLSAADFKVPQNRKRIIFIGFRRDLFIFPTLPKSILTVDKHIPVKTILEKRADVDDKYFLSEKALAGINAKKLKMKEKGHGFGAQYLDPDKPSFTIPARYWKDGYDALVWYDDNNVRRLTENELKKIQSFPSEFVFEGTKKEIIIQIGNAVASNFAFYLGKYLEKKLNSISGGMNTSDIKLCLDEMKNEYKINKKKNSDMIAKYKNKAKKYQFIGKQKIDLF